jgi:hypothetical protein
MMRMIFKMILKTMKARKLRNSSHKAHLTLIGALDLQ